MNPPSEKICAARPDAIDASCRWPLLVLFGGAAVWLVVGLALGLAAMLTFHAPDIFADCPFLSFGRAQAAANNAVLYGFCLPAGLGMALWIMARLSRTPLALPLVPFAAAHIWHLGVTVGVLGILAGESTGHPWLEFPRAAAVLLFTAFMLILLTAVATFGRREPHKPGEMYPSLWFLLAALLLFPWIYSTANLLLIGWPVRGVTQAVIGWWYANNLLFVWLGLVGVGTAFYFLPKISGRPLGGSGTALFGFFTLLLFGAWCGIPQSAPVPVWLPVASRVAAALTLLPLIALALVFARTMRGAKAARGNTPFRFIQFGLLFFFVSGLLYTLAAAPRLSSLLEFTWFMPAQVQLQLLGFFAMVMFGAIYQMLPGVLGLAWPFPKWIQAHFWLTLMGGLLFVSSLAIAGVEQGMKLADATVPLAEANFVAVKFLRVSSTGQLLLLLGAGLFAVNLLALIAKWKWALVKSLLAKIKAPLPEMKTETEAEQT